MGYFCKKNKRSFPQLRLGLSNNFFPSAKILRFFCRTLTQQFCECKSFFSIDRLKLSEKSKDKRTSETFTKNSSKKGEVMCLMLFKTKNGQTFPVSEKFGILKLLQSSESSSFRQTQTKNLASTIYFCSPYESTSPKNMVSFDLAIQNHIPARLPIGSLPPRSQSTVLNLQKVFQWNSFGRGTTISYEEEANCWKCICAFSVYEVNFLSKQLKTSSKESKSAFSTCRTSFGNRQSCPTFHPSQNWGNETALKSKRLRLSSIRNIIFHCQRLSRFSAGWGYEK